MSESLVQSPSADLVLWGASVRAASWSAMRAGFTCLACDQFADLDFPSSAQVERVEFLTQDFLTKIGISPHTPLLLCGGTENRRTELTSLAGQANWWTSPPAAIRLARDPQEWRNILIAHELPTLAIRTTGVDYSSRKKMTWLRKPLMGCGGIGIRKLADGDRSLPDADHYDQEFQPGLTCSAQFLSSPSSAQTRLLGCTRQLSGLPELFDRPFGYVGNLYPLLLNSAELTGNMESQLQRLGEILASACGLQGLWGLDFVLHKQTVYPLEINPRYTAALELIELAEQRSFLAEMRNSPQETRLPKSRPPESPSRRKPFCLTKQILYASDAFLLPLDWSWEKLAHNWGLSTLRYTEWEIPVLSDLPAGGTDFRRGDPVCTIWGTGTVAAECLNLCEERRLRLLHELIP